MRKRFADLSIGSRILIGFGLVAGLMLVVAGYGLSSLAYMERAEHDLVQFTNARRAARSLDVNVLNIIVSLQYFMDTRDPSLLPQIEQSRAEAERLRAEIRSSTGLSGTLAALDRYDALLPRRRAVADEIIRTAQMGGADSVLARLRAERHALDDDARVLLARIIAEQDTAANAQLQHTRSKSRQVRRNMTVLSVTAVALMILLTTVITRSITRPLRKLQLMTERVGEGDYQIQNDIDTQDEIGAFAHALNVMAGDVARLDLAKDEFIGVASHQLRTPATAVKNFIGLLREGYAGEMTEEQKSFVEYAWESNEQQLEVVDGLLRVARSESGRLVLEKAPVDLEALAARVVAQQAGTFRDRRQKCRLYVPERPVVADADLEYLQMAVENLVSNASKYTPEGGRIVVAVMRDEYAACILVRDNGVGIAATDLPRLFGKFSRIKNELSTQVGGSGIGLYLTRRIVDQHGGSIHVVSLPGRGTTFTIRLTTGAVRHG